MPLYKKGTSKARVQTQNSFISPLLSQNKVQELIKDDYKENLPIPTKKKLLEPLINIASNRDLFDKLQQKSFKDSSKTLIEVSKRKETWPEKNTKGTQKLNKKISTKVSDLTKGMPRANTANKSSKSYSKSDKSKDFSKTLSDLSSQSPLIFGPSPTVEKSIKRLKTEKSMTITTKIGIKSYTDEDLFNIKTVSDTPNTQLSDLLNDCVVNNLRMSQQLLTSDDLPEKHSVKTPVEAGDVQKQQKTTKHQMEDDDHDELVSSLRSLLDEVVNTNDMLSQTMLNDDDLLKDFDRTTHKRSKKNKERQKKSEDFISGTKKTKTKVDVKKGAGKSKENIQTSFNIEEKKKKSEKKKGGTKETDKSKGNVKALKSQKKIKSAFKCKEIENRNDVKIKSFKRLRDLCSDDEDQLEEPAISNRDFNKGGPKKIKATDSREKLVKRKSNQKYLIEKQKSKNGKTRKDQNKYEKKEITDDNIEEGDGSSGGKKLERDRYSTNIEANNNGKRFGKNKPKNMIFTSAKPETIAIDLKKLLELQEERDVGLYVYCDTCDKVRYLPECKDPLELPAKWYCHMNPDPNYNKCSDPDFEIEPEKEELMIFNKYHAGSIVWAKMDGYPWWPAMVDDDPNLSDYFWLDHENSTEPSWYHVTFFDSSDVTRAWIRTENLAPFEINEKNPLFKQKKYNYYRNRLGCAKRLAKAACKMGILKRLKLFSFVTRYFKKQEAGKTQKDRKRGGSKTDVTKDILEIVGAATEQLDEPVRMEDNDDFYDDLSVASSEIISCLSKSKKAGKNIKIASDDNLEKFDLNYFICDEDMFDAL